MKFYQSIFFSLLFCFSFCDAQELPKVKLNQFRNSYKQDYRNDTLSLKIENPLACTLRIKIFSDYLKNKNLIDDTLKVIAYENSFAEIKIFAKDIDIKKLELKINQAFGDDRKIMKQNNLALPFPKGKTYQIMQSNKGSFSHNDDYSRYAVDFDMKVGDTITSADDGFVVGVIKDYEYGGNDRKWRDFANYITIYHPQSGLFTQYVHLKKDGSFVKVGDAVKRNQPLGLSGATGYASGEHLHFNVLIPKKGKTLKSVPFSFENNLSSQSLQKNMKVTNK
ncbi:M23 family metallopeptidase [Chryseobacterium balustinum]|uniref:M23 family metallopeptidase n=1 Tax=Chryseobacterium balustinum TaxID=246 RepID=UPI003CF3B3A1